MNAKDLKAVKDLVLWLRHQKIAYSSLSAGGVTLDGVVDMKIDHPTDTTKPDPRPTMFERYGAELLKQPAAKPSETVPEEALLE